MHYLNLDYAIINFYTIKTFIVSTVLRSILFRSSVPFQNCCTLLALPISPDIMDGFGCSRCLNDRIDLPNMKGIFTSGANAFLVAKNGTKKIILLPLKKSTPMDGF